MSYLARGPARKGTDGEAYAASDRRADVPFCSKVTEIAR
jgi:hypothetical protein